MNKQIQSAMYFLVWHCGMSFNDARAAIKEDERCILPMARAGHLEGKRCFDALSRWTDKATA